MGTVEHRCGPRQPVSFEAILHSPVRGDLRCQIRNLSAGGLYAELGDGEPPLGPCALVDVLLALPGSRVPRTYRWPAMVVYRRARGMGLMFDRPRGTEVAAALAISSRQAAARGRSQPPGHRSVTVSPSV